MAKRDTDRLSAVGLKSLTDGRHADGGGLYLYVSDSGARSWVFRWKVRGKRREMGLGALQTISLKEARIKARELRQAVTTGRDPIAESRSMADRNRAIAGHTFSAVTEAFLKAREAGWSNPKHRAQWQSTLEEYAYPHFRDTPVAKIETADVLRALTTIWNTKNETASRVRGRIESVLSYASALKYRSGDNPARWRGHLDQLLPKPSKVRKVTHHRALPYSKINTFIATLRKQEGTAARALEFTILTAARSGSVLGAQWNEIDHDAKVWRVPAERMKAKRAHAVPLSDAALAVLKRVEDQSDTWIFPNTGTDKRLSENAMLALLDRMGVGDAVPHGFRSTFRDWAAECTTFPNIVAEAALAHSIKDKAEAAYRRGDLLAKRASLMSAWATYCCAPIADKVVPLNRRPPASLRGS